MRYIDCPFLVWAVLSLLQLVMLADLGTTETNADPTSSTLDLSAIQTDLVVAWRAQRDVSMNVPIDQQNTLGVSLNEVIFNELGYNMNSMNVIGSLLSIGVQTMMVDFYWNEYTTTWQLCPAPFPANSTYSANVTQELQWNHKTYKCEAQATIDSLMSTINNYTRSTNTNMDVNMLQLLVNLKSISLPEETRKNSSSNEAGTSSLSTNLYQYNNPLYSSLYTLTSLSDAVTQLGSNLYTPRDLQVLSNPSPVFYSQSSKQYPTLSQFLLTDYRRISTFISSNELSQKSINSYNLTAIDNSTMFYSDSLDLSTTSNTTTTQMCHNLVNGTNSLDTLNDLSLKLHFRFVVDSHENPFTESTTREYVRCGYSPILNNLVYNIGHQFDLNVTKNPDYLWEQFIILTPFSLWSWTVGQPLAETTVTWETTDNGDDDDAASGSDTQVANKCVVITSDGWTVTNCYDDHPFACQNTQEPNQWSISLNPDDRVEYFAASTDHCPLGYVFAAPRLSIEMLGLMNTIRSSGIGYPVWIDMNDITVPQCFVTGGPYASCPYEKMVSYLKLVQMITPNIVVAAVILILIFLEKFVRKNPIQLNRKRHWKRKIVDFMEEHDYQGVPS